MTANAWVSGRAGRAVIRIESSFYLLELDQQPRECSFNPMAANPPGDLQTLDIEMPTKSRLNSIFEKIYPILEEAWLKDRTLMMVLMGIDPMISQLLRERATKLAEEGLTDKEVFSTVRERLLSTQLPKNIDMSLVPPKSHLKRLLEQVELSQSSIIIAIHTLEWALEDQSYDLERRKALFEAIRGNGGVAAMVNSLMHEEFSSFKVWYDDEKTRHESLATSEVSAVITSWRNIALRQAKLLREHRLVDKREKMSRDTSWDPFLQDMDISTAEWVLNSFRKVFWKERDLSYQPKAQLIGFKGTLIFSIDAYIAWCDHIKSKVKTVIYPLWKPLDYEDPRFIEHVKCLLRSGIRLIYLIGHPELKLQFEDWKKNDIRISTLQGPKNLQLDDRLISLPANDESIFEENRAFLLLKSPHRVIGFGTRRNERETTHLLYNLAPQDARIKLAKVKKSILDALEKYFGEGNKNIVYAAQDILINSGLLNVTDFEFLPLPSKRAIEYMMPATIENVAKLGQLENTYNGEDNNGK